MNAISMAFCQDTLRYGFYGSVIGLTIGVVSSKWIIGDDDQENGRNLKIAGGAAGLIGGVAGKVLPVAISAFKQMNPELQFVSGLILIAGAGVYKYKTAMAPQSKKKGMRMIVAASGIAALTLSVFHGRTYALDPILWKIIKNPPL